MAKNLAELLAYLERLQERASLAELTAELEELEIDADDLAETVVAFRTEPEAIERDKCRIGWDGV